MATKGPAARALPSCRRRASTSLPVPVSPLISTGMSRAKARLATWMAVLATSSAPPLSLGVNEVTPAGRSCTAECTRRAPSRRRLSRESVWPASKRASNNMPLSLRTTPLT